jgi:hypothetical protein
MPDVAVATHRLSISTYTLRVLCKDTMHDMMMGYEGRPLSVFTASTAAADADYNHNCSVFNKAGDRKAQQ